ncbi:MAG: radical SAM protein [Armatimonadota bacterium]
MVEPEPAARPQQDGLLGLTSSVCPECRSLVPARVMAANDGVYLRRYCPRHGESAGLIWHGLEQYLSAQSSIKPAWWQAVAGGDASLPCPRGCGLCERHEQHLCLPVVEITGRCDLECPICLVNAGTDWCMAPHEFRAVLANLIRAEGQIRLLNLSGGEPLLHPDLLALIDEALSHPEIVRVSISTNGLRLLADRVLVEQLRARDVVLSLQFDGFSDPAYQLLRGRSLLEEKLAILDLLRESGITTSLTMTAAAGVNDDQLGRVAGLLFSSEKIVSMMVQPLAFAGRARAMKGRLPRLSIPDIVSALGAGGHPAVSADDFLPLPCSHPLCFSLAFYLMTDGGAVSLSRLVGADLLSGAVTNRVFLGLDHDEQARLKEMIYAVWSAPAAAAPESRAVLRALRAVLRELSRLPDSSSGCGFDARRAFAIGESRLKSIFVHAFQDDETFDLARARRCCTAYPQPDGRLIPVCVRNVLGGGVPGMDAGGSSGA